MQKTVSSAKFTILRSVETKRERGTVENDNQTFIMVDNRSEHKGVDTRRALGAKLPQILSPNVVYAVGW